MRVKRQPPRLLLLLPVVVASVRVFRSYSALPLDRAVARLGTVQILPAALRDPEALEDLVNRMLPFLPPRRMRPCLKRALLLMDLLSRCGLDPRFHLGVTVEGDRRSAHAWVGCAGSEDRSVADCRYSTVFELPASYTSESC